MEIVANAIRTQSKLLDAKIKRLKSSNRGAKSTAEILRDECKRMRKSLERIEKEKMKSFERYVAGDYSKEQFLAIKADLTSQETEVTGQINLAENQLAELTSSAQAESKTISHSRKITEYQELTELTSELVQELVKEIVVYPDNRIKIVWNFHDDVAAYMDEELLVQMSTAI